MAPVLDHCHEIKNLSDFHRQALLRIYSSLFASGVYFLISLLPAPIQYCVDAVVTVQEIEKQQMLKMFPARSKIEVLCLYTFVAF